MSQKCLWNLARAFVLISSSVWAQNAKTVLESAQKTMGDVKSVQYSGSGMNAFFGQALTAGKEWPRRDLESVRGAINYEQKSAMIELNFKQPVFGGQKQVAYVNGEKAWAVGPNGAAVPQNANAEERQLAIWMTPHGFVKAALAANDATAKSGKVTFTAMGKYKITGTIDKQGLVTQTETMIANPVMGDIAYIDTYSDYKDFGGAKFPTKIVQSQGGYPVNEFTIASVQPGAAADFQIPANVQSAATPPVRVETQKLGDGVWFLGGGSHHSLVVEFNNFITVIEGPLNEERSLAVIAEAKKLAPNKPIKYVVSTHHHFDHSGGLRTYVAEGATIVTDASNQPFFAKTLVAKANIAPDSESKAHKKARLQAVSGKYVITDGKQSIECYTTKGDTHTDELMVVYIPSVKVLVEADSFSPGPPNAPAPNPAPPNAIALWDNVQRLKLDVSTVVGIHGRGPVPMAEFAKFVGKS